MENVLGVLGGMGPLASQLFYRMLTEKTLASKDQDHLNLILLSHATMPDRTAAIQSGKTDEVDRLLLQDMGTLEALGCRGIVAACNTAHYFLHRLEDQVGIPLISMIRETARQLEEEGRDRPIAILATEGTVATGLYQEALKARHISYYLPDEELQAAVNHLIYGCIKEGKAADPATWTLIDETLQEAGCGGALLACTELSVAGQELATGTFYLDPLEILAESAIAFMGKTIRTD